MKCQSSILLVKCQSWQDWSNTTYTTPALLLQLIFYLCLVTDKQQKQILSIPMLHNYIFFESFCNQQVFPCSFLVLTKFILFSNQPTSQDLLHYQNKKKTNQIDMDIKRNIIIHQLCIRFRSISFITTLILKSWVFVDCKEKTQQLICLNTTTATILPHWYI